MALADLPGFVASFSVTARFDDPMGALANNVALDEMEGVRVDLDAPTLDITTMASYEDFRRQLLENLRTPSVLIPYRPSDLSTSVALSERASVTLAGMLGPPHARFDYKPWVEVELSRWGVPVLPWEYVADEDRESVARRAESETLVLRPSSDSGGEGIVTVSSDDDVDRSWPSRPDALVAVSPYLEDSTSINLSGVVFADGSCRLHPPSVQIIGVPGCTQRQFGYCGNDFGAVAQLGPSALADADRMGRTVSAWLHGQGYIGAFGIDAIAHDGKVWFTEINPRFQGSSSPSAEIARALDVPDLFVDHLLATLGLGPVGPDHHLSWWAESQPPVSHVVVHNVTETRLSIDSAAVLETAADVRITQLPRGLAIDPGGTLGRLVFNRSVTVRGDALDEPAVSAVNRIQHLAGAVV